MKRTPDISAWALAAAACLIMPQAALGQEAMSPEPEDQGITEIVVTATKMGETNLQSTPIAMSAISGEDLAARGIRDVQDLKAYVPSLQVSDLSGYTQLYVRGIGSNSVFIGSDPSTTMHLDGVYLARPLGYLNDFSTSAGSRFCEGRKGRFTVAIRLAERSISCRASHLTI